MSNSFASTLMPRILAGALQVLREEVAFAKGMNKDFEASAGHLGQQISVAIPYPAGTYDITPAAVPPALTDATQLARLISVTNWKGTRFSFTPKEMTEFDFGNSQYVPRSIAEAARAQARLINQSIAALWTKIPNVVGANDARLFASTINNLADVRTRLSYQLCPDEERALIMGLEDENDAMKLDDVKKNPQMAGDHEVYRKAMLGRIYDIDLIRDRDVVGAANSTANIAGTLTCANTALGSLTIVATATGGDANLPDGTIIMLSDDSSASSNLVRRSYAVQGTTNIANTASGVITLDHPLEATIVLPTVSIFPKQGGRQNIAGQLAGFGLVMRIPPSSIEGAPTIGPSIDMADPVSGIPMKLTYLPGYHSAQWELSTLWGVDVVDWRRLLRVQSKIA
jgi:hypothetical protein